MATPEVEALGRRIAALEVQLAALLQAFNVGRGGSVAITAPTGLSITVSRFLAIIRYQIIVTGGRTGRFTSYAFLVEGDGPIQPMDANERIALSSRRLGMPRPERERLVENEGAHDAVLTTN